MPKRPGSSDECIKKKRKYEKLQRKLDKLREELADESDNEEGGQNAQLDNAVETIAEVHAPPLSQISEESIHFELENQDNTSIQQAEDLNLIEALEASQNETLQENVEAEVVPQSIDLFGEDPSKENLKLSHMRPDLATLIKGLEKNVTMKLLEKFPPASNCTILNPEILSALKDKNKVREDKYLQSMQSLLAASIIRSLYEETESALGQKRNVEYLANFTNLNIEVFHKLSLQRRFLLGPHLNTKLKKFLEEQPMDKFLYGENLIEKLKENQTTKSVAFQVSSIIKPQKTNFTPRYNPAPFTQQRATSSSIPQRPLRNTTEKEASTRSLNFNTASSRPRIKQSVAQQNYRTRRPTNFQSSQWRPSKRQQ